jgi:hypothetical protein
MLLPSTIFLVASLITPHAVDARNIQAKVSSPTAFQAPSANYVTSNVLTLTKKASSKGYNAHSAAWLLNKPGTIPRVTAQLSPLSSLVKNSQPLSLLAPKPLKLLLTLGRAILGWQRHDSSASISKLAIRCQSRIATSDQLTMLPTPSSRFRMRILTLHTETASF